MNWDCLNSCVFYEKCDLASMPNESELCSSILDWDYLISWTDFIDGFGDIAECEEDLFWYEMSDYQEEYSRDHFWLNKGFEELSDYEEWLIEDPSDNFTIKFIG